MIGPYKGDKYAWLLESCEFVAGHPNCSERVMEAVQRQKPEWVWGGGVGHGLRASFWGQGGGGKGKGRREGGCAHAMV